MQLSQQNVSTLPSVFSPGGDLDYYRGRVFGGVAYAEDFMPEVFMHYAWQHPDQLVSDDHFDGTDVLEYLVQGFDGRTAQEFSTFMCRDNDQIQHHFGIGALEFIRNHWNILPKRLIAWASKRRLYAAADTFWGDDKEIYIPCLDCLSGHPVICGHSPHSLIFDKKDVFLRD